MANKMRQMSGIMSGVSSTQYAIFCHSMAMYLCLKNVCYADSLLDCMKIAN